MERTYKVIRKVTKFYEVEVQVPDDSFDPLEEAMKIDEYSDPAKEEEDIRYYEISDLPKELLDLTHSIEKECYPEDATLFNAIINKLWKEGKLTGLCHDTATGGGCQMYGVQMDDYHWLTMTNSDGFLSRSMHPYKDEAVYWQAEEDDWRNITGSHMMGHNNEDREHDINAIISGIMNDKGWVYYD